MLNSKKINRQEYKRIKTAIKQSGIQNTPRLSETFWKDFNFQLNKKIDALEEKKQDRFVFNVGLVQEKLSLILRPLFAPKYAPAFALVVILIFVLTAPTLCSYYKLHLKQNKSLMLTAVDQELLDDLSILDEISTTEPLNQQVPLDNENELESEMDMLIELDVDMI